MKTLSRVDIMFKAGGVYIDKVDMNATRKVSDEDLKILSKNLNLLGYKLSKSLSDALTRMEPLDFTLLSIKILELVTESKLADVELVPLWENFEDRINDNKTDLRVSDLLSYIFPYLSDHKPIDKKSEGFDSELKSLRLFTESDFNRWFNSLLEGDKAFTNVEREIIEDLINAGTVIDTDKVSFSVNKAFIFSIYNKLGIEFAIDDIPNIVRYIQYTFAEPGKNSYDASRPILSTLTNGDRNHILDLFNKIELSDYVVSRARYYESFLKDLNRVLHANSKRNYKRFPVAGKLFEIITTNGLSNYKSDEAILQNLIADNNLEAFTLLSDKPTLFIRYISRLTNAYGHDLTRLMFNKESMTFDIRMLDQIKQYYLNIKNDKRIFNYSGKLIEQKNELEISDKDITLWLKSIDAKKQKTFALTNNKATAFVIPHKLSWNIPSTELDSGDLLTIPKGSKTKIEYDKTISAFAHWSENVDIDLSMSALTEDFKEFTDSIFFGNLSEPWGIHSGDVRGQAQGTGEVITADVEALCKFGARYLVPTIILYSGFGDSTEISVLKDMDNLRIGVLGDFDSREGLNVKKLQSRDLIRIAADSTFYSPYLIDLDTKELIWLNSSSRELSKGYRVSSSDYELVVADALRNYETIYNMIKLYADIHDLNIYTDLDDVPGSESSNIIYVSDSYYTNNKNLDEIESIQEYNEQGITLLYQEMLVGGFKKDEIKAKGFTKEVVKSEEPALLEEILDSSVNLKDLLNNLNKIKKL